jgi:hypothetical protein
MVCFSASLEKGLEHYLLQDPAFGVDRGWRLGGNLSGGRLGGISREFAGTLPLTFVFVELRAEFHMLRHYDHPGMGLTFGIVPTVLLQTAHDPDPPTLVAFAVAVFGQLGPTFHIEEAHLPLKTCILLVKAVGHEGEATDLGPLGGSAKQRLPDEVSFNKDTIETVIHICLLGIVGSGSARPPGMKRMLHTYYIGISRAVCFAKTAFFSLFSKDNEKMGASRLKF